MVMAQTLFAKEKKAGKIYTTAQKLEVLEKLENTSTREAKKIVAEINPEMGKRPTLDFNLIEDDDLREKLLRIKGQYAHTNPTMTLTELLHRLCDEKIEMQKDAVAGRPERKTTGGPTGKSAAKAKSPAAPRAESGNPKENSVARARREVMKRDRQNCTNCGSTHAIEIDHIVPQAMGGPSSAENMRVLCRSCNQRWAIKCYGDKKMSQYLKEPAQDYSVIIH